MAKYEVIVGNIGCVYTGTFRQAAVHWFNEFVTMSKVNYGRAAGEQVTMFEDDEIAKEYIPDGAS